MSHEKLVTSGRAENSYVMKIAPTDAAKKYRESVLAAVRRNPSALEYAPADLKNDHDFVLAAVRETFSALEYASDDLKNDHGWPASERARHTRTASARTAGPPAKEPAPL